MTNTNEWQPWSGGECPVDWNTLVDVKFRAGTLGDFYRAGELVWIHLGMHTDIIAYRLYTADESIFPDQSADRAIWRQYACAALTGIMTIPDILKGPETGADKLFKHAANIADAMLAAEKERWG